MSEDPQELLPGQQDEQPEPGDTVIELNADGVPIIYTEPERGTRGQRYRSSIRAAGGSSASTTD